MTRPRGVPKEVPSFTHVTRYTGNVIFTNRAMIKIKLLTVDFPVNYPAWVSSAKELQKKDAAALKDVRAGLAELKKAFPSAMPPRTPVKDHAGLLAIIARIELSAGKLM